MFVRDKKRCFRLVIVWNFRAVAVTEPANLVATMISTVLIIKWDNAISMSNLFYKFSFTVYNYEYIGYI